MFLFQNEISKGCDILICSPSTLLELMKQRETKLGRVVSLVLENTHILLQKYYSDTFAILHELQKITEKRTFNHGVQLTITSYQWTTEIEKIAKRLYYTPTVCIGVFVEAALYGKVRTKLTLAKSEEKLPLLKNVMLRQKKIVILCNTDEEVASIYDYLKNDTIFSVIFMDSTTTIKEQEELQDTWNIDTKPTALISTDHVLFSSCFINVHNANLVIQYSLPKSWTTFSQRFSLFLENYISPVAQTASTKKHKKSVMQLFLDEENSDQLGRMIGLFKRLNVPITDDIMLVHQKLLSNRELEKIRSKTELCEWLKLFGECLDVEACKFRHHLNTDIDISNKIPQSGIVKFKILHMFDVTRLSIRIFKHTDSEGYSHDITDRFSEIGALLNNLSDENTRKTVYDCKVGTICAYKEKDLFRRCIVTKILETGVLNIPCKVEIRLMDVGKILNVSVYDLFLLPSEELANIPPQYVEVYIANLIPPEQDIHWSDFARIRAQKLLRHSGYENTEHMFVGRIKLQLENTLWLNDVILTEYMEGKEYTRLTVKNSLLKNNIVQENEKQLNELYSLCTKFNFTLPDYTLPLLKPKKSTPPQALPLWAHLENCEEYNMVYFCAGSNPQQFFIRLCKHEILFNKLTDEIQNIVKQPDYIQQVDVFEGRCYLAKDPKGEQYARVIVNKIDNNIAECFFVDYGDYGFIPKTELKYLSDNLLTKLPFQVIECSLFGVRSIEKQWSENAIDLLYEYATEPDSDLMRYLNVKVIQTDFPNVTKGRKYSVLLIDSHIEKSIINKVLIDKNLAVGVKGENLDQVDFEKLKIDEVQENDSDLDEEYIRMSEKSKSMNQPEENYLDEDNNDIYGNPEREREDDEVSIDICINRDNFLTFIMDGLKTVSIL